MDSTFLKLLPRGLHLAKGGPNFPDLRRFTAQQINDLGLTSLMQPGDPDGWIHFPTMMKNSSGRVTYPIDETGLQ